MGVITLNIENHELGVKKTMKFEPSMVLYDVCRLIHDKIGAPGSAADYGLLRVDEAAPATRSYWLEATRKLDYYLIRSG